MRKIEEKMCRMVMLRRNWQQGNTRVSCIGDQVLVYLFGNLIYSEDIRTCMKLYSTAGWNTVTTRSRLNALGCGCHMVRGVLYRDGREWTSDW